MSEADRIFGKPKLMIVVKNNLAMVNMPIKVKDKIVKGKCRHCGKEGTLVKATMNDNEKFVLCAKDKQGCDRIQ